jgi:hypothetical protein
MVVTDFVKSRVDISISESRHIVEVATTSHLVGLDDSIDLAL